MHHLRQMIKSSLKNCCTFITDDDFIKSHRPYITWNLISAAACQGKQVGGFLVLRVWGLLGGFTRWLPANDVLLSISVATVLHKLLNEFCSVRNPWLCILDRLRTFIASHIACRNLLDTWLTLSSLAISSNCLSQQSISHYFHDGMAWTTLLQQYYPYCRFCLLSKPHF